MRDPAGGRSKLARDPELRAFVAARIGQLTYRELADLARRRFGPARAPSRSAIGRYACATGQQRSRLASKIERDPELRVFVAARVARLPYRELADQVRAHFGPERAVSHSAIGRWAGAVGRRRRRGWLAWIDADLELSSFLEDRADRMSVQALAERARAAFGDRAPPRAAINRWDARRRAAKVARSPARGVAGGRTAPEMPLQQRARCSWCDRSFSPRKGTGGSPQHFCGAPCRRAFHSAARHYVQKAIAEGRLTLADLRTLAHADLTRGEMAA